MVMMMAEIRPTQFSALKVLDHLHEEEERGEDDDGHADDEQVIHGNSYAAERLAPDGMVPGEPPDGIIKALISAVNCRPHGSHAAR
jgi:hypothetical protein